MMRKRVSGSLVPRSEPGAFVKDPDEAVRQAGWLLRERGVRTLCVHGDNPQALAFVKGLREAVRAKKALTKRQAALLLVHAERAADLIKADAR